MDKNVAILGLIVLPFFIMISCFTLKTAIELKEKGEPLSRGPVYEGAMLGAVSVMFLLCLFRVIGIWH